MDDYDVFLNHRGPDVKGGFIAHLEEALRQAGLNPFLDKASLKKGDHAFRAIDKALEVARVHVAVVSRRYAESKHCLNELVAMLRSGKPVIPIFYDVQPTEMRRVGRGVFAAAFRNHRTREPAERVQEWVDALCELADITAFVFRLSDYEGNEAELKQKVVNVVLSLVPSHGSLQVESHLVGLEEHVKVCVSRLKMIGEDCAMNFLCLVGMGGIGKTSLAKGIYNHLVGDKSFRAMSFLEIGRTSPTSLEVGSSLLNRLQKQLVWDLLHVPTSDQHENYGYWFSRLSSLGPILIVLDDIQDKDQFDKLIPTVDLLSMGSCIIVTSRDQHLLKVIVGKSKSYLHQVTPLGCEDSQRLFNWHAFGSEEAQEDFKALANDVSKACCGLPLALKVIGSSLFGKTSDEDQKCIWPEAMEALKGDPSVMRALKWGYDCLLESEKLMFVDIACVFCGWKKQEALEVWRSCKKCSSCCGSGTPHISLQRLIDKSMVVIEENLLVMHGLLQDIGISIGDVEGSHLWENKAMKVIEDKNQNANKVRAMNLANSGSYSLDIENFVKMPNLHFLILDGCEVHGNIGSISKELRYLQWRHMPLTYIPPMLKLSNLISLDFSESTKLVDTWIEGEPSLEGCPNLLRLNLSKCTSITTLPDSIGCLSSLQILDLTWCGKLQKLPEAIGKLTTLEKLYLSACRSLEALPDSITALSRLRWLECHDCSSNINLPTTSGLMTGLTSLHIDLADAGRAFGIGQLNLLEELSVARCIDEAIIVLDSSGTLRNLHQLFHLGFYNCPAMTKFPETIGLLTNLDLLELWHCENVRELPNSIGGLKVLTTLYLRYCCSLETLPDSLGALASLQQLWIVNCASITRLPSSVGHLSSLLLLQIQGCGELRSLPESLNQLNALRRLQILECGSSLEGLGLRRALRGLRIWGCTSITQLPGSCLVVVDSKFDSPAYFWDGEDWAWVRRDVKEVGMVEVNDCGVLRQVQEERESGRAIVQRVHNSSCCETVMRVRKRRRRARRRSYFGFANSYQPVVEHVPGV